MMDGVYVKSNLNPEKKRAGDCTVRAISAAIGKDWETTYLIMCARGLAVHDMPSMNYVWGSVLRDYGFKRFNLPDTCPDCYTAAQFAGDHPEGTYVLGFGDHAAVVIDGVLLDSWNSSGEIVIYAWEKGE